MNYISKAEEWAIDLYPNGNGDYHLSKYAIIKPYNNGYIIFHTITWSIYFLTSEEYNNVLMNDFLIKNKVVINSDVDEDQIAELAYKKRSDNNDKPYGHINKFVILTTNSCNANCPYCYEKLKSGTMTTKIADDVIKYILKCGGKNIEIQWFGGEPLVNYEIIDYISQKLIDNGIELTSKMISNGSLFNNEILEKAKNLWNLKQVQITIDGLEEYYNKTKNYNNIEGSPFNTVIDNIKNIMKNSNIKVHIRINVSHDNIDDIDELVDKLNWLLFDAGLENVHYYFSPLYDITNDIKSYKKNDFNIKYLELNNKYLPDKNRDLIKKHQITKCMADSCKTIVISPTGTIFNCEHVKDYSIIGDIYNGITGNDVINGVLEKCGKNIEKCKEFNCKLLPICERVNFCEAYKRCEEIEMFEYENETILSKLEYTAKYYFDKLAEYENKKKGE